MLLRQLAFSILILGFTEADLSCPYNYQYDTSYGCLSTKFSIDRNSGYTACAAYTANFFRIRNAYDNTAFLSRCHTGHNCWLGITCSSTNVSSCQYDNGDPVTYNNFAYGHPNPTAPSLGPCVYFNAGNWFSGSCFNNQDTVCQIDQTITPRSCHSSVDDSFYRGRCYFNQQTTSLDNADKYCKSQSGQLVSVHSQMQNQFVYEYLSQSGFQYAYLGLQASGQTYHWNDQTAYDYSNFGLENPTFGSCVLMSLKNSLSSYNVSAGQWFNNPCDIPNNDISAVCVKDLVAALPDPVAPILCDTQLQLFTNSSGTIYSAGYPRSQLSSLTCGYGILLPSGTNVTATFNLQTSYGTLAFYNTFLPGALPFYSIYSSIRTGETVTSDSNMMKIVFTAGNFKSDYLLLKYGQQ